MKGLERLTKFGPLLLIFFTINLLLFYKSYNAGFVTDFTGLQEKLETQPFSNFIYSYGYPIVQPLLQLINAVFYKLFHINPLAWFLYYLFLHSLISALIFRFADLLFRKIEPKKAKVIALLSSIFFLASAYHPEVMCWRISTAFLWSGIWILSGLIFALLYLRERNSVYLTGLALTNAAALLTFEWGLIVLPLVLCLALFNHRFEKSEDRAGESWKAVLLSGMLTCAYFILNYVSFGSMLAHYGSDVHLNVDVLKIISAVWKYFFKHLFLIHYFPHGIRDGIYSFLNHPAFILLSTVGIVTLVFLGFRRFGLRQNFLIHVVLLLFCIICLVPVANLSFEYLFRSENDRYGYIFSIFLAIYLSFLVVNGPKWFRYVLAFWFVCSLFFQQQMMENWNQNKQVFWGLMDSFPANDVETILALNVPDNLGGTFLFRDFSGGSSLADGLKFTAGKSLDADFYEVCQYNMLSIEDGVVLKALSDSSFQVSFKQFGTWFWKRGKSSDYENDLYRVKQGEGSYTLTLKSQPEKMLLIYQDGPEWKTFRLN
jgi:hypothetical protein